MVCMRIREVLPHPPPSCGSQSDGPPGNVNEANAEDTSYDLVGPSPVPLAKSHHNLPFEITEDDEHCKHFCKEPYLNDPVSDL